MDPIHILMANVGDMAAFVHCAVLSSHYWEMAFIYRPSILRSFTEEVLVISADRAPIIKRRSLLELFAGMYLENIAFFVERASALVHIRAMIYPLVVTTDIALAKRVVTNAPPTRVYIVAHTNRNKQDFCVVGQGGKMWSNIPRKIGPDCIDSACPPLTRTLVSRRSPRLLVSPAFIAFFEEASFGLLNPYEHRAPTLKSFIGHPAEEGYGPHLPFLLVLGLCIEFILHGRSVRLERWQRLLAREHTLTHGYAVVRDLIVLPRSGLSLRELADLPPPSNVSSRDVCMRESIEMVMEVRRLYTLRRPCFLAQGRPFPNNERAWRKVIRGLIAMGFDATIWNDIVWI